MAWAPDYNHLQPIMLDAMPEARKTYNSMRKTNKPAPKAKPVSRLEWAARSNRC